MLGLLKIGEKGKIIDLSRVDRLVKRRLLDLGIFRKAVRFVLKGYALWWTDDA
jgi:Fe2+ transport system protein FeoA